MIKEEHGIDASVQERIAFVSGAHSEREVQERIIVVVCLGQDASPQWLKERPAVRDFRIERVRQTDTEYHCSFAAQRVRQRTRRIVEVSNSGTDEFCCIWGANVFASAYEERHRGCRYPRLCRNFFDGRFLNEAIRISPAVGGVNGLTA